MLDNGRTSVEPLLAGLPEREVRYLHVERTSETVIGGLRNIALEEATGDLIVPQWDDDDWSHPERIARQVGVLEQGYDACTLAGTLMHVDEPSYFEHPFIGLLTGGVPPTIMHRRDADIRYPELRRTSDSTYTAAWRERRYAQLPLTEAHLYIRYFHGGNLWEIEHFLRRMRNTPVDLVAYGWYRYVRRDVFRHPRFRLSPDARQAFGAYLEDSRSVGLFREVA